MKAQVIVGCVNGRVSTPKISQKSSINYEKLLDAVGAPVTWFRQQHRRDQSHLLFAYYVHYIMSNLKLLTAIHLKRSCELHWILHIIYFWIWAREGKKHVLCWRSTATSLNRSQYGRSILPQSLQVNQWNWMDNVKEKNYTPLFVHEEEMRPCISSAGCYNPLISQDNFSAGSNYGYCSAVQERIVTDQQRTK